MASFTDEAAASRVTRRHDATIRIRKLGKDMRVAALRDIQLTSEGPPPASSLEEIDKLRRFGLSQLVRDLHDGPDESRLKAAVAMRRLFQSLQGHAPTIARLRTAQPIDHLVTCLSQTSLPRLQFELIWALSMAAWDMPEDVMNNHATVQLLVSFLQSPCGGVREQCCWTLGNLSSIAPEHAAVILAHSTALTDIVNLFRMVASISDDEYVNTMANERLLVVPGMPQILTLRVNVLKQTTWAISSFLKHGSSNALLVETVRVFAVRVA
jgi:hypothetical protein